MYSNSTRLILRCLPVSTDAANAIGMLASATKLIRILTKCQLVRLLAAVDVVLDTSATVVTVTKRVTMGSDTSAVAITTLTVPTLTAAGKVVYKDFADMTSANCTLNPGDELKFVRDSGGGSGSLVLGAEVILMEEQPSNCSDMIESA